MDENTTVINLDELEKSGHLEEAELIYREEYDRLCLTIIQKVKRNVEACKKGTTDLVSQPCFFINGGRGSGKTTLLRAVRHKICSENVIEGTKIHELAAIDPTELAETENFFIHILGRVQKKLSDMKSERILNDEDKAHLRNAYTSIRKMSKGLGLLVRRPEDGGNSTDAGFFVQQRVEDCVSGLELKQEFAKLVETLCKLFKVDAMLVTVDDADMNFNKCSEVFETVRKYLINTRMAFVFAGDLKLYAMVVRAMQLNHFGELALAHDTKREEHRFQLLDVLEDQYVMKLFPVENRIWLSDFGAVIRNNPRIKLAGKSGVRLQGFLKEMLRTMGWENSDFQILEFIRRLSTRSALQLIAYWFRHIKKGDKKKSAAAWTEGIRLVATQMLMNQGIDSSSVCRDGLESLIPVVISHVKAMDMGMAGAALMAGVGNEAQQMVSFYLAAEVTRNVKNLADVIQYALRIFSAIQISEREELFIDEYQYTGDSYRWGAICTARMMPRISDFSPGVKLFANGIIPLFPQSMNIGYRAGGRISLKEFVDKLVNEVKSVNNGMATCSGLAVYHALGRVVEQGRSIYCLSVFNLLDMVARLLDIQQASAKDRRKAVENELKKSSISSSVARSVTERPRSPLMRLSESRHRQGTYMGETVAFDGFKQLAEGPAAEELVDSILKWLSDAPNEGLCVSPRELCNLWFSFMMSCQIKTNNARVVAVDEKDLALAGELFKSYLNAFFEYGKQSDNTNLRKQMEFLSRCPLCQAWSSNMEDSPRIFNCCNQLNIGPMELIMDRDRASLYCKDRVQGAKDRAMLVAGERFDDICRSFVSDAGQIPDTCKSHALMKLENQLRPLYERYEVLAIEKRKGTIMPRYTSWTKLCKSIILRMNSFIGGEVEKFRGEVSNKYNVAKKTLEETLNMDAEERCERIMESARDLQDEKEFESLVNRSLRTYEGESNMLEASVERKLKSELQEMVQPFQNNLRGIVDNVISSEKDKIERLFH